MLKNDVKSAIAKALKDFIESSEWLTATERERSLVEGNLKGFAILLESRLAGFDAMDFTYFDDGLFVSIVPETPRAVEAWNTVIAPETDNTGKVLAIHFPLVKLQLEDAGYTIDKAQKLQQSDKDLLGELL